MGYIPNWYPLIKAARFLGVAPWDLFTRPVCWREWALMAEAVEREQDAEKFKGMFS